MPGDHGGSHPAPRPVSVRTVPPVTALALALT
jgi:hypothetical protein